MRRLVLIVTVAFIAGLFTVSQGLGAGEYGQDQVSEGVSAMEQSVDEIEPASAVAAVQLDNKQISEVQRILTDKGFEPGADDGVLGSKTQKAIRNFQESQGLAATGQPDEETLRALAPDAETQELLGLSPQFSQDQIQQDQMQEQPAEQLDPMQDQTQDQIENQIDNPVSEEPTSAN